MQIKQGYSNQTLQWKTLHNLIITSIKGISCWPLVTPKAMASDGAELPEPRPGTTAEVLAATEYPAEDCAVCFDVLGEAWSRMVATLEVSGPCGSEDGEGEVFFEFPWSMMSMLLKPDSESHRSKMNLMLK